MSRAYCPEYHKSYAENNKVRLKEQRKQYYERNRELITMKNREWRKKNPLKLAASKRRYHLKYEFGMTVSDYTMLFQKQEGLCAICKSASSSNQSLAVDHNHKTGKIRGLLCVRCNRGIGAFGDCSETLNRAAIYLKESYE